MSLTPSTMLPLGTEAPIFRLPNVDGKEVSIKDYSGYRGLVVTFVCNHCPYVKHLQHGLVEFTREYQPKGIGVIAISSNDISTHPDDAPHLMRQVAAEWDYPFPYLYDETQDVAKAYRAACTPDFFLFNEARRLVYRGQFDDSRPGNDLPVSGASLRAAADALLRDHEDPSEQKPSMGCNIKWKRGNEPDYFGQRWTNKEGTA